MEWNKRLGLSASLLAGGTDELPQLFPGPGQPEENRDLTALICFQRHLPITGWRASPVFKCNAGCLGLTIRILKTESIVSIFSKT